MERTARTGPPRLLWVSNEEPAPELSGGSLRQYNLLLALAARVEVDLLLLGQLRDERLRVALHEVIEVPRLPFPRFPTGAVSRRLYHLGLLAFARLPWDVRVARNDVRAAGPLLADTSAYDVVDVEHLALAPLLPREHTNRWVLGLHNLASVRVAQEAAVSEHSRHRLYHRADARRACRIEQWATGAYDVVTTVSDEDAARIGGSAVVVPIGFDSSRYPVSPVPNTNRILFTASWNFPPNVDGAEWFCAEVLPKVRAQRPEVVLDLVGREPDQRVRALARLPGVEAAFDVPSLLPYFAQARVCVVPLRAGTGTRVKGLEAMAAARPLVGTTVGLEGLFLEHGTSALVTDDAQAMAAAVCRVLDDDALAQQLATGGRSVAERQFDQDAIADHYVDAVVAPAVAARRATATTSRPPIGRSRRWPSHTRPS